MTDPTVPPETQAAMDEQTEAFLTKLGEEAEAEKYKYMTVRVPQAMREAFDAKFPPPEPPPAEAAAPAPAP